MTMRLNDLKPAEGSKPVGKRVGRGHAAGQGKTAGRGHKGQKSRSGGYHKVGFEGGQQPLQRRLPKVGFNSPTRGDTAEVRLHELNTIDLDKVEGGVIDLAALQAQGLVAQTAKRAKIFLSGELSKAVKLKGILATAGAKAAIEKAGGSIEAPVEEKPAGKLKAKVKAESKADSKA